MRSPLRPPAAALVLLAVVLSAFACGPGDASTVARVTIEPIPSATPAVLLGGKPAAPPPPTAIAALPAEAPADVEASSAPPPGPTADPPAPAPSPTPAAPPGPPSEGRWIDVDVTNFVVRLMDGASLVREIGPVAVGEEVDTGAYLSTQTGLFHVYNRIEGLAYDTPYDTYISHWVGFDPAKDNGFHSFLKDAAGNVVDASTGRVSNGCIRTGDAEAIFAFSEVGMPVWVHH